MPERWHPTDDDLERSLRSLGEQLDYPSAGGLADGVTRRLRERPRPAAWWRRLLGGRSATPRAAGRGVRAWAPVAAAGALVLVLFAGSLVAFPVVRETVADWLGLRGIGITIVPTLSPIPTRHRELVLGAPMSLDEARAAVPWALVLPDDPALGPPDEVYVDRSRVPDGVVSLVWSARPGLPAASTTGVGLLLTELRAGVNERYFEKMLGPGTTIERVHVGDEPGYWISGEPHEIVVVDRRGEPVFQDVRLAGDVLMWEHGELTLRIESALSRDDALRVGATIR